MRRILVTGNAGSGKSTLAARLGELLGLDVVGLDRVVWRPGWQKAPPDERRAAEREMAARPAWVVDGVSSTILTAADLVIFLDLPRPVCLWRCLRRSLPYLLWSRPGLPERCPELLILPHLVRLIWRFPAQTRPAILAALSAEEPARRCIWLRSSAEVQALVSAVAVGGLDALRLASEQGLKPGADPA